MSINIENFQESTGDKFILKRRVPKGMLSTSTLFVVGDVAANYSSEKNSTNELDAMIEPFKVDVSLEKINEMSIIINDSDCSDTFFSDVCNRLSADGIVFSTTRDCTNINDDNNIVITLDQQYSSGSNTIIFAPYNNTRLGYSDSLVLAMQAAFKQNGFLGNTITCGKIGYREDGNGNVTSMIPTETEEAIDPDNDTSFVTISFGTQNVNSDLVAKSIENGLARQKYYLDNYDGSSDLIYSASTNDSVEVIADYFNSDINALTSFNEIDEGTISDSQTIINPKVNEMEAFDINAQFNMDKVNTRVY